MKISRIEHLGIAVQSIDEVLPYFRDVLGLEVYKTEVVEDQKVKTAFMKVGEVKIELLEPTCPESTVQKFLDNGGRGVHHVAFKVHTPYRQGSAQWCRQPAHRIPAPEEHLRHTHRTLRRIKENPSKPPHRGGFFVL